MKRLAAATACLVMTITVPPTPTASAETRRGYSASALAMDDDDLLYVEKDVETWRDSRLASDFAVPAVKRFARFELIPEGEVSHRDERAR